MGPKDRLHATDTERIDQAMFESFPASDSPAWTLGSPGEGVEEIPDFRLPASTGQTLAKSAFIGKMPIVLIFVSDLSTDESVATLTAFNDALAQFGHRVSQVLGVARMTARLAREAAERHSINFPILADASGEFARSCAVADDPHAASVVLVVDSNGVLHSRISEVTDSVAIEVLASIDALETV
ncbi:MAG: redoxin domain-containing protein [Acidimicrobiia bacterium]|nr:redoxin domain-containing protein [Acidimicrobiia bacterium]